MRAAGRSREGTSLADVLRAVMLAPVDGELLRRLDALDRRNLNEFGVDPFGFSPEAAKYAMGPAWWLYKHYFRVQVRGAEHIPATGRVMLVANHGGQLPFDGAMTIVAALAQPRVPRMGRAMVEKWSTELPFVSTLFARCGQIVGTPDSCRRLLQAGECIVVFPEGAKGINKLWKQRYQLQEFGLGFMRLALETGTPIIPVGIVGHEEQALALWNFKAAAKLLGMPALPITPTLLPLPLPSRYHIRFGAPLRFTGDHNDEDDVIGRKVGEVKQAMQALIEDGLKHRGKRVFW